MSFIGCDFDCESECDCWKIKKILIKILRKLRHLEPSYGAFWQTNFVTVPLEQPFPFNFTGPTTPDITLENPTTIRVKKSGVYQISFRVAVAIHFNDNPADFADQRVSLYVNNLVVPNSQAGFGILVPDVFSCVPIYGDAIVYIPANATLQIRNDGHFSASSAITTCDNGVNAVTFNIVKIG